MTLDVHVDTAASTEHNPLEVIQTGPLDLETGGHLPQTQLGFETFGTLNADASNAILVLHALTGDTHAGDGVDDSAGWWPHMVGPGCPLDTEKYCIVVPAALGGCVGTTGPASLTPDGHPYGSQFPFVTLRDMAVLERRLMEHLGVEAWFAAVGGSMGGARALEWAATFPDRVQRCVVLASTAASSAEQIALAQVQTHAIRLDPGFHGGDYYGSGYGHGPQEGLGVARRLAHISYRSAEELAGRFGRNAQEAEDPLASAQRDARGRYAVESYLDYQATKLVGRFDPNAYLTLTEALMSHDVGRGRGGVEAALGRLTETAFFIAAVDTDRLYYPSESQRMAQGLPGNVQVHTVITPVGHDGFLTDGHQLAKPLKEFLSG